MRIFLKSALTIIISLLGVFSIFSNIMAQDDWEEFYEDEQLKKLMRETYDWQRDLIEQERQLSELSRQREELKLKLKELLRLVIQEKSIAEVMLRQQREEESKLREIERLWRRATRLYDEDRYQEAIDIFQQIINLEGKK